MKHLFIACLLLIGLSSCKNDVETTQDNTEETVVDSIPTIKGEFIYIADAAVLKGDNFIYGVKIDAKAQELAERVKPLKREDFDMVPVEVKGKIMPNKETEGWDEIVEIREIIKVSAPTSEPAVKVKSNDNK
ncbi:MULTISPECIES: hypothetical protein [Croceibacter]|jgi:hypothetical protein|uniref:NlpE C-terminal OB domain-containing protein n=1 Tax=Croceibacter atlanticus (strain ATCC BAA-628 / JCM 21780 / CIP 108009 / IAM 15332 / KCTC 12090 / HTCC2559) TaxID=216432 RepID=A3U6W2_CROAH|nr:MULTISPECIES: hypothetical protein [Croceibacter]HAT69353.1 hypothetical protein [Flavobacteriaceae bacterium]EAP87979.1 hypothetical protein CA2559_04450 [Croceibacter atlanticus HTCC2559]MAM22616.1 hypothetical protein [Croceibacter sp.]MBG25477.1 hypothetical protein [Croceibacter sp.]MBW4969814.1 hypothetical protein [Croceibacter atlanticus]|tara:strand:+ start:844 stop:1239 length:396 start_codon:yes stop_codon:yes gene_type:complete